MLFGYCLQSFYNIQSSLEIDRDLANSNCIHNIGIKYNFQMDSDEVGEDIWYDNCILK